MQSVTEEPKAKSMDGNSDMSMLTIEQCSKILNQEKTKYNNEEVKQIREFLYLVAKL